VFEEESLELPQAPRRELDSDVELTTSLGENTDDLRRRYIEERFPEIMKGAINADDPDSIVKGARLFYEDGAIARAVELLQFAIERKPAEVKTWLALFEIFRLERLSGEFAELAQRFKELHGKGTFWRKVQFFGREIDPGNKLYQDESFKSFETIGPAGARRMAEEASFDPIAENWLNAPMDFQNEVLANELRKALMAQASLNEQDLVANPMPALRNVEMFTVA
jgi:pilus assembly protein FimV